MRLEDAEIVKLLPTWMQQDGSDQGLSSGCDKIIRDAYARIKLFSRWNKIDQLSSSDLDELAWELNILWYNSTASLYTKRKLIKTSDLVFARSGTRWAVETVVTAYFGDAKLLEWFEYGGDPNRFKIELSFKPDIYQKKTALQILEMVKRKSQWLECFVIHMITAVHQQGFFRLIRLRIRSGVWNWGRKPVLFNGSTRFNGSLCWDQLVNLSGTLRLRIAGRLRTANVVRTPAGFGVRSGTQTPQQARTGNLLPCASKNTESGRCTPLLRLRCRMVPSCKVGLIWNAHHTFSGQRSFDGRKKFNGGVSVAL